MLRVISGIPSDALKAIIAHASQLRIDTSKPNVFMGGVSKLRHCESFVEEE